MNEPTEHEKQIARDGADAVETLYLRDGCIFRADLERTFLSAVAAAKQQQNEDTARLDVLERVYLQSEWNAIFVEHVSSKESIRERIDARGVQPAAKELASREWFERSARIEGDSEVGAGVEFPAAQQESAPAAEQEDSASAATLTPRELPSQETGSGLIAIERARQISQEGWTPEHDDEHTGGTLAVAGAAYALQVASRLTDQLWWGPEFTRLAQHVWQWDQEWWKPSDNPVRDLTKAGALIAAEIDRLLRECSLSPDVTTPSGISVEAKPESESVAAQEKPVGARVEAALRKIVYWGENQLQGIEPEQIIAWMTEAARAALASASSPSAESQP